MRPAGRAAWPRSPRRPACPTETLRKIETGRIATPAFFTVAALAAALAIPLEEVVRQSSDPVTALTA